MLLQTCFVTSGLETWFWSKQTLQIIQICLSPNYSVSIDYLNCSLDIEDGGISSNNTLKVGSRLQNMQTQTKNHAWCRGERVLHHTSDQERAQAYYRGQWQVRCVPLAGPPGAQGCQHCADSQTEES